MILAVGLFWDQVCTKLITPRRPQTPTKSLVDTRLGLGYITSQASGYQKSNVTVACAKRGGGALAFPGMLHSFTISSAFLLYRLTLAQSPEQRRIRAHLN